MKCGGLKKKKKMKVNEGDEEIKIDNRRKLTDSFETPKKKLNSRTSSIDSLFKPKKTPSSILR